MQTSGLTAPRAHNDAEPASPAPAPQPEAAPPSSRSAAPQTPTRRPWRPRGAPERNRHGLRSTTLPKACRRVEHDVRKLRIELERELGTVSILSAAAIQSACRHEVRARLAERWLRLQGDNLTLAERLSLLQTISAATDSRDKALRSLPLERDAADVWSSIYRTSSALPAADAAEGEGDDENQSPIHRTGAEKGTAYDHQTTYGDRAEDAPAPSGCTHTSTSPTDTAETDHDPDG